MVDGQSDSGRGLDRRLRPVPRRRGNAHSLAVYAPSYLGEKAVLDGIATYKGDAFAISQFTAKAGDKALAGSASYKGNLLTLHPLTLSASGNSLSGSVVADLSGAVPAVNAAFSGQTLNLDTLLPKKDASAASTSPGGGGPAGWSDAKIDFSGLRAVTAQLKLSAGQLVYNNIKISQATLQATISGGKLTVALPNFKLYKGAGALALDVDASGKVPDAKAPPVAREFRRLSLPQRHSGI